MLPLIVWGRIVSEAVYEREHEVKRASQEQEPGMFALDTPYEGVVLIIDERCPARYVNDAYGVHGAIVNVDFMQHPDARELHYNREKGLQLLLQGRVVRPIAAGEQLFTSYGKLYWEDKKVLHHCTAP